jgi:anaerobic selenocysteine-containing dehydrogenase
MPAQQRVQGEQSVWLNPENAHDRDIAEGDIVRVHNERGEMLATAKITTDVSRGVVMAPMGVWRSQAKGQSTVNAINPTGFADLGNAPTFSDTRVEVERA